MRNFANITAERNDDDVVCLPGNTICVERFDLCLGGDYLVIIEPTQREDMLSN